MLYNIFFFLCVCIKIVSNEDIKKLEQSIEEKQDNKKQDVRYKTKIKTFNPRYVKLQKNKLTVRNAFLWSLIPLGGFVYLKSYVLMGVFGTAFLCLGAWFGYNLYQYKKNKSARNQDLLNKKLYFSGGILAISWVISILVSIILAKKEIFDITKDLRIVIKPSLLNKSKKNKFFN